MNKTPTQEKMDLLKELFELISSAKMDHDLYGTTKEDAFISGINEGIGRACDLISQELEKIEQHD